MIAKLLSALVLAVSMASVPVFAKAPDLGLLTTSGAPASLDQWVGKGKWVLVMFWATNCAICEQNKPSIVEFHDKYKDKNAVVVGVAIDGMDKIEQIKEKMREIPANYTDLVAQDLGLMAANFQIAADEPFRGTPTYWFFSPKGELKAVNPGPVRLQALEDYMARFPNG